MRIFHVVVPVERATEVAVLDGPTYTLLLRTLQVPLRLVPVQARTLEALAPAASATTGRRRLESCILMFRTAKVCVKRMKEGLCWFDGLLVCCIIRPPFTMAVT